MDVIEEELGKLSFLDPHSSEFKYDALCAVTVYKCKKLNSLKHPVRTTVARSHN